MPFYPAAMRRLILAALIFLTIGPVPWTAYRYQKEVLVERATAQPLALTAPRDGPMRLVRGWHLESPHSRFGGFSALARLDPGRFLLVGDNGYTAELALGKAGVSDVAIRPLPKPSGWPQRKSMIDSEALAIDPATGKPWIGLENINEIWRLDAGMTRVEARFRPSSMRQWSNVRGPEAMAWLPDGRLLVLAEGARGDPRDNPALLFAAAPGLAKTAPTAFFYDSEGKGAVSDAVPLPDGRVLLVHRKIGWHRKTGWKPIFTTTIARADPADIRPGGVWRSRTIGVVPRALADNFEGAAVTVERGRTWLWLVSDDNFNRWQRSLLLQFELTDLSPRGADSKKAAR